MSGLSPQHNPGLNPVLTSSQGPLGDINLLLLPHSTTSLMVGANSIGNNTTWNARAAAEEGRLRVTAAGCCTRRSAFAAQYAPIHGFGFETRIYDLTYPMIDLYGNLHIAPGAELFFGQRDITHASRRNTFGVAVSVLGEPARPHVRIGIIGAGAMGRSSATIWPAAAR